MPRRLLTVVSADVDATAGVGAIWILWRPKSSRLRGHIALLGRDVCHVLFGVRRIEVPKQRRLIAVWKSPRVSRGVRPLIVVLGHEGAELSRMGPQDGLDTHTWARQLEHHHCDLCTVRKI
ncbi:hypothetical protein EJC51_45010 [Streptomyces aquilus]|uniref:Uncharacterized protein n=1 Tax=Streptomyces aquilus TaxID=2548456 RepID=A0A3S9IHD5_9ACTN|nr:hypothetical protein EJC51_45010 [Streptomyces aquilus]